MCGCLASFLAFVTLGVMIILVIALSWIGLAIIAVTAIAVIVASCCGGTKAIRMRKEMQRKSEMPEWYR